MRSRNGEEGLKLASTIFEAGISVIEITMAVPNVIDIIQDLAKESDTKVLILDAGTALDPRNRSHVYIAGAKYIVAPNLNEKILLNFASPFYALYAEGGMRQGNAKSQGVWCRHRKVIPGRSAVIRFYKGRTMTNLSC